MLEGCSVTRCDIMPTTDVGINLKCKLGDYDGKTI